MQGELYLLGPRRDEAQAEAALRLAIDVACKQNAKLMELRACVSLARLRQAQNKRAAAHELLQPIYDWFTEGFSARDLIEAKSLLDELKP
jgi:predicted ATPase